MAHISTESVKEIRKQIKKTFPGFKFSITREHHTSINIALLSANISVENTYEQLNHYYLDEFYSKEIADVFEKIKEIMFGIAKYHNNSDSMTDYFDVAYYYHFSIGQWNKPYICK